MIVRDALPSDTQAISDFHKSSGIDYRFPDLEHPLFFVRKVAERDGAVVGACFLRITAETYLWLDPSLRPNVKLELMQVLQPEVLAAAWRAGIDDIEARIPETVQRRFSKRLKQLGWTPNRSGWHPWTRETSHA